MAKFLHLKIHDVHQLDHMECKFFPEMESELIDCGEWGIEGLLLSYLLEIKSVPGVAMNMKGFC